MNKMKALSIQQPWAWLIVNGYKSVENRSWPTKIRGEILIHAGKKIDMEGYHWVNNNLSVALPTPEKLETGGIVGKVEIYSCVTECDSPYFFGEYGFLMKNSKPLPFQPCKGMLGFFEPDIEND